MGSARERLGVVALWLMLGCALPCLGGWVVDGRPVITVAEGATGPAGPQGPAGTNGSDAATGTFPVFRLDVGLVDGHWTDFELKASTNNFATMEYYYASWTPTQLVAWADTNIFVYFTDDYSADVRVWHKQTNGIAISAHLASTNSVVPWVYVYPSHQCAVGWSNWMSATKKNLVWSYVRADNLGCEMNATGTKQRWSVIRPESWEVERTVP